MVRSFPGVCASWKQNCLIWGAGRHVALMFIWQAYLFDVGEHPLAFSVRTKRRLDASSDSKRLPGVPYKLINFGHTRVLGKGAPKRQKGRN